MKKHEFRIVRRHFKLTCRRWYQNYFRQSQDEFVVSDESIRFASIALRELKTFAALVGCENLTVAAAMLNGEKWREV